MGAVIEIEGMVKRYGRKLAVDGISLTVETGIAVGIVVGGFFAIFIALLFGAISALRLVSPFHYFAPSELMAGQGLWKVAVLLGVAVVALGVAAGTFARRDLTH